MKEIAAGCVTRHHSHHYLGFAATEWDLFQRDEPPRVKPLLYVYRVLLTGIHLMRTGKVEANLVTLNEVFHLPYVPELVERKIRGAEKGTLASPEIAFHKGEYERLTPQLEAAANDSHLPNEAGCRDALNDLLVRIRLGPRVIDSGTDSARHHPAGGRTSRILFRGIRLALLPQAEHHPDSGEGRDAVRGDGAGRSYTF